MIIENTFVESRDWIKNKKCTINPQNKKTNVSSILSQFIYITKKLRTIQKEYQRLNHLLTILIGKILIFHQ